MTKMTKMTKKPKSDWKVYRWKLPNGEPARGICKTTDDPWEVWSLDRTIALEHRATIHDATEEQALNVMGVLLV